MSGPQGHDPGDEELLSAGVYRVCRSVALRCPTWSACARATFDEVGIAARLIIDQIRLDLSPEAEALLGLFGQAAADFQDLLVDVSCGRPAIRTARSLVEAHVASLDCASDPELAQRWIDSAPTADAAIGRLQLPQRHLRGKTVKSYRHLVGSRMKRADATMATAVQRWGSGFRRSWNPKTLFDRAVSYGLDDVYEFYRMASAPVHASGGGSVGLRQQRKDGGPTVRTGFALEPVPLAALYGTAAMRGILHQVARFVPEGADRLLGFLDDLDESWEELYTGLRHLDREVWPVDAPVNRAVLIVQEPDDSSHCYEYLPELARVRPMIDGGINCTDRQVSSLHRVQTALSFWPHRRVGIFVHEAKPTIAARPDVNWSPADFDLESQVHVRLDGTVGLARPPEDDEDPDSQDR